MLNNQTHQLGWQHIVEGCVVEFAKQSAEQYKGVDLVAGGVPCPPFSKAGKQLGKDDERDLFPAAIDIVSKVNPKAVMIENVAGLLAPKFDEYRQEIDNSLSELGYVTFWKLHNASDFGVSQLRPRVTLVALAKPYADYFQWPEQFIEPLTVGETLGDLMAENGWEGAQQWQEKSQ